MSPLLVYHKEALSAAKLIESDMYPHIDRLKTNGYDSITALKKLISRFFVQQPGGLIIFLADTQHRLNDLDDLRFFLEGRPLLFILPDETPDTLQKALTFYPKFITKIKPAYSDLCSVIDKIQSMEGCVP